VLYVVLYVLRIGASVLPYSEQKVLVSLISVVDEDSVGIPRAKTLLDLLRISNPKVESVPNSVTRL
jgi:hypothetical protein